MASTSGPIQGNYPYKDSIAVTNYLLLNGIRPSVIGVVMQVRYKNFKCLSCAVVEPCSFLMIVVQSASICSDSPMAEYNIKNILLILLPTKEALKKQGARIPCQAQKKAGI